MATVIPKEPPSYSSTTTSGNDDGRPAITSHLYLRPSAAAGTDSDSQPPLDKEMVLRRIRRCKRVNRLHGVLDSFLRTPAEHVEKDRRNVGEGWLGDAFSSP